MENISIFEAVVSILGVVIVGVITYVIRRLDTTPGRPEFSMTVTHLEAEIGHNKAQLEEMKRQNEKEYSELKVANKEMLTKFEESIKRLHDKLEEINEKIK